MKRIVLRSALIGLALPWATAQAADTEIVSLNSLGSQGFIGAQRPSVSDDSRFVAFQSESDEFVDIDGDGAIDVDSNGFDSDVFVYDRDTGKLEIVSVNSAGLQANDRSLLADISADGRYVTFSSQATNLVDIDGDGSIDADLNGSDWDVFVHDRVTGTTEIVSVNTAGQQGGASSQRSTISSDGRYVIYSSQATNLVDINGDGVPDPDANGSVADVFVHDRSTGVTEVVSVNSLEVQGTSSSAFAGTSSDNGRYVAFVSNATNLVDIDGDGSIDPDDNASNFDVFVRDRVAGVTEIVHVNSTGQQGNAAARNQIPDLSRDGRFVAFTSSATNLVDIDGDGSIDPDANGSDEDVFVHDRTTGTTEIAHVNSVGVQGNDSAFRARLSANGRFVGFWSFADNLMDLNGDGVIDPDTNGPNSDVFLHDRNTGVTEIISVNNAGQQGDNGSQSPDLSGDGGFVAFWSFANNLVDLNGDGIIDPDTNGAEDAFLRVRDVDSANVPPTADAGGPYVADEGGSIALDGSGSMDDDGDLLTYAWDYDEDGVYDDAIGVAPTFDAAGLDGPDGLTIGLEVNDGNGGVATATATLTINNVAPVVGAITGLGADPIPVNTLVNLSADFTDDGTPDTHTGEWDWGDTTTTPATITQGAGSGTSEASHSYSEPGTYSVACTVTDDDAGVGNCETPEPLVVYDPNGGFVTGSVTISSPPGAYASDPSLSGPANVTFVAKYKKGQNTPMGNATFGFQVAGLSFNATSYDWLVVDGAKAVLTGDGSIQGLPGSFGFQLFAVDGAVDGSGIDKFRIKIVDTATNTVIYDNEMGGADDADPTTAINNGSIVIHNKGNGKNKNS